MPGSRSPVPCGQAGRLCTFQSWMIVPIITEGGSHCPRFMTSHTAHVYRKTRPLFGLLVIAVSAITIAAVGKMLWFGIGAFAALLFAYFIATSAPELSNSAPGEASSKLKYVVFLAAFIAAILAVVVGRNYPFVPWPDQAETLSPDQVQSLLTAHRTLLFGVCTLFAVAYLHIVLLILGYVRHQRKPETKAEVPATPTAARS
jgi:hypothetical protein